jgi:hypothetical protein
MNLPTVKDCVLGDKKVVFVRYQSDELWYRCESGFEFSVACHDTGAAAFLAEDKALMFMRWIRKHLAFLEGARAEAGPS